MGSNDSVSSKDNSRIAKESIENARAYLQQLISQEEGKASRSRKTIVTPKSSTGISNLMEQRCNNRPGRIPSCEMCRQARTRCSRKSAGDSCGRCIEGGYECVVLPFQKLGRRRVGTKAARLALRATEALEEATSAFQQIEASTASKLPASVTATELQAIQPSNGSGDLSWLVQAQEKKQYSAENLDNPLMVLAGCAVENDGYPHGSPLFLQENAPAYQYPGTNPFFPPEIGVNFPVGLSTLSRSTDRLTTNSSVSENVQKRRAELAEHLYGEKSDAHPSVDPINCAIISEKQAEQLITFYFDYLLPFALLFRRELYTLTYLRSASPLLLTTICLVSSLYEPELKHLSHALMLHARRLIARLMESEFRSVYIVQALCLFIAWPPARENGESERAWVLLGAAVRIATEIRLDHSIPPPATSDYSEASTEDLIQIERCDTWMVICVAEISLSVSTRRSRAIQYVRWEQVVQSPKRPHSLEVQAAFEIRVALAESIDTAMQLQASHKTDSASCEKFVVEWTARLAEWRRRHGRSRKSEHLISMCRNAALRLVEILLDWKGPNLRYASNPFVNHISYVTAVLCRLVGVEMGYSSSTEALEILERCQRVADILRNIGEARLYGCSPASIYSENLCKLISSLSNSLQAYTEPSLNCNVQPTAEHEGNIQNSTSSDVTLLHTSQSQPSSGSHTPLISELPLDIFTSQMDPSFSLPDPNLWPWLGWDHGQSFSP